MEERTGDDEALLGVLYGLNEAEVFSVELLEVCLPTLTTTPRPCHQFPLHEWHLATSHWT